ncbi:MAG: cyclic nucleotide-binding domain-containing protein, partial [Synergistaceae bacterium]|nr:cyclic nucleotide-binding domain-containing protein [Synergistaceae bacterium]
KIVSGRALCFVNYGTDDEYLLGSLKEGKTFGEYSLLTGKPGIYTVTAYTDMLLMRIGRGDFTKFIETNAGNSVNIMQNMAAMMNVMKVNIDMLNGELHAQN